MQNLSPPPLTFLTHSPPPSHLNVHTIYFTTPSSQSTSFIMPVTYYSSATVALHFLFLPNFSGFFFSIDPQFQLQSQIWLYPISPVMFLSHLPYMEDPLLKSDTWPGIILLLDPHSSIMSHSALLPEFCPSFWPPKTQNSYCT